MTSESCKKKQHILFLTRTQGRKNNTEINLFCNKIQNQTQIRLKIIGKKKSFMKEKVTGHAQRKATCDFKLTAAFTS